MGYSKEGVYSVKTAYMLGKGRNLNDFHRAWVELWKLDVSPKTRLFLWILETKTLPVRVVLKVRHLIEDSVCPRCGCEE